MAAKMNNKTLILTLAGLIVVFILVKVFRSNRFESTMGKDLIEAVDTAKVTEIRLFPSSEKGAELHFTKENSIWLIEKDKLKVETDNNNMRNLLSEISNLKVDQLIAKGKDKWKENFVDDTTGTKIMVYEGKKLLLEMVVGKFNYKQSKNPYQQYGRGGISGNTSVRISKSNDVYAVKGFLSYAINQPFNNWRNQSFLKTNKSSITKLSFIYPADSSYVIEKKDSVWYLNNEVIETKIVEEYLNKIAHKTASSFEDNYIAAGKPHYQLNIEGNNMPAITVSAYKRNENDFVLNSSQNSKNFFSSSQSGLISEIFVPKNNFLK